jgi:hypothetical protein
MESDPDLPETMPSDCRPVDAINPHNGKKWKVYVRKKTMEDAVKRGPGKVRELGYTVPDAFLYPKAVFRGDRDEGESNWLCYVSRPEKCYDYKTGDSRRAWLGEVFVAKLDEFRILQWFGWLKEDDLESHFDEKVM